MIDTIQRIPCDSLSVESFRKEYEEAQQPIILVGCDEEWAAKEKWTFQNLAQRFDLDSEWRAVLLEGSEDFYDDRIQWRRIVDAIDRNLEFYVFDNLNTTHGKTVEKDYEVPPFFRHDLFQYFDSFPVDYGPMRWFALGSRHTGTMTHFDPFETDAWNSVVHGMKWWMLFPPYAHDLLDDDYDMLGCDPQCSDEDVSILDYYNTMWQAPSKDLFRGESIIHVFQKEGETLYIPSGTIHR